MKKFYFLSLCMLFTASLFSQTAPPYTQVFTTFPLEGWALGYTLSADVGSGPTNNASFYWQQKPFLNNTAENNQSMRINMYTSKISYWAVTNAFDLSGGDYEISFDCATGNGPFTPNPSGPAPQIEAGDNFKVLISTNGGTVWEELKVWENPNIAIPNKRTSYKIDVSAYHGNNVKFAFYASDGTVYNAQANYCIYVDDFKIDLKATMSVNDINNQSKLKIYPNPASDKVFIETDKTIKSLELYDTTGKKIKSASGKELDVSSNPKGIYIVKATFSDNTSTSQKVIKK